MQVACYTEIRLHFRPNEVGVGLSGNELTRNSSGNIRSQSSQLAEPLWTDPGLKSGINVRELISALKKEREAETERQRQTEAQAGNELLNILPKSSHAWKKPPHHQDVPLFETREGVSSVY